MSQGHFQTLLAKRAVELLGDGQWHDYETVLAELMKLIPPGQALRRTEQNRVISNRQWARRHGLDVTEAEAKPRGGFRGAVTKDQQIRAGQRFIARSFLKAKVFQVDRPGNRSVRVTRQIRMVKEPRAMSGDPLRQRIEILRDDNIRLREQQALAREWLIEHGHQEVADKYVPIEWEGS